MSIPQYKDDNSFGPETVEWTNKFKLFSALDVDGTVDSMTWGVMQDYLREHQSGISQEEYDRVVSELEQSELVVADQLADLRGTAVAWKTVESVATKYGV